MDSTRDISCSLVGGVVVIKTDYCVTVKTGMERGKNTSKESELSF